MSLHMDTSSLFVAAFSLRMVCKYFFSLVSIKGDWVNMPWFIYRAPCTLNRLNAIWHTIKKNQILYIYTVYKYVDKLKSNS